mmetsp:Transcript_13816/g.47816  ORF Transcript_13816/g.47816 Transcript_13816/m.47816 type:complete len:260 (-) Transcript_13816:1610-2389(-)
MLGKKPREGRGRTEVVGSTHDPLEFLQGDERDLEIDSVAERVVPMLDVEKFEGNDNPVLLSMRVEGGPDHGLHRSLAAHCCPVAPCCRLPDRLPHLTCSCHRRRPWRQPERDPHVAVVPAEIGLDVEEAFLTHGEVDDVASLLDVEEKRALQLHCSLLRRQPLLVQRVGQRREVTGRGLFRFKLPVLLPPAVRIPRVPRGAGTAHALVLSLVPDFAQTVDLLGEGRKAAGPVPAARVLVAPQPGRQGDAAPVVGQRETG